MFAIDDLILSDHARKRMHQRAIRPWMVEVALDYGETVFDGKGCIRCIVTDKALENTPYENDREQLRGLCVVVSLSDGTIVTVEWVYNLKRKYPRLNFCRSVKNSRRILRSNQWTAQKPSIPA
ncbi:MAG: DUF4258 domain-containing protein [Armatimonadetes bacterium]|nr:DUF4258 domain-containing protein [Armatimonadota bacterium]MCX7967196.1 DUF4258 domain-containing protein [Armatimonadota bacterium]MDW8143119.1 DUF4258 domain-containing protein [Armatimonadota bacterium]